jgi:signal transduction histidine kinase/ligand-binding sensor domain-containing protein
MQNCIRTLLFTATAVLFLLFSFINVFGERLPVKIYTSADGLGSGFVDYLYRDSRGFMWFCTRDGLSRFDGSGFVTYAVGDSASPPGIENIFESRDGKYWISTTGGLYRFDPQLISGTVSDQKRLAAERVSGRRGSFLQDSNGTLWMGSTGLFRVDQDSEFKLTEIDLGLSEEQKAGFASFDIAETNDGSIWLQTSLGLIRRLPDERIVLYPIERFVPGSENSMISDRTGRIWFASSGNIFVLRPEPIERISEAGPLITRPFGQIEERLLRPNEFVELPKAAGEVVSLIRPRLIEGRPANRFFQSTDGEIWISADTELLNIKKDGILRVLSSKQGLPSSMSRMAEDAAGNLWIGGQAGLGRLDRVGLVTFDETDGLNSSRFFSITEDPNGSIYFGQSNFFLAAYDGTRFTSIRPRLPADAAFLWNSKFVLRSRSGDWWFLTREGLYRYSGVSSVEELERRPPDNVYGSANGLDADGVFQIFEDAGGDIWVSVRGHSLGTHGISRLRRGESSFESAAALQGFPKGNTAISYAEDNFGHIWMGFYDGILGRYDGSRFELFGKEDGVPAVGQIVDLHVDAKGRLWLATSNFGLLRIDDPAASKPAFISITAENGLKSDNVRTLAEDRLGRIYAGTARGVSRIEPDTLNIKNLTVADGLAADFVVDSRRDRNGDLWFATNNGVSRLTPVPDERTTPPPVFIGGLRIAGIEQPIPHLGATTLGLGELGSNETNFQISFFGLDFRAGETLRFQYKLEGADPDWSPPVTGSSVTYANLRPGSYRFLVRAVSSDGSVSETPSSLSFTILSPVWQRWWFLLGLALSVFGITFLVYRYRTSKLREINRALTEAKLAEENLRRAREERLAELERVRSRIATDLHDDIGASLTQIAVLSEVARAKTSHNGEAAEPLEKITAVSNELVGTMSDIVWSINPAKDHLSDLVQRMRRFAADLLSPLGISFRFVAPEIAEEIVVSSSIRREIFLIFKEAINNIVRHSGATDVRIELAIEGDEIVFRISDNGRGFVPSELKDSFSGNGFPGMRRRVNELGGRLSVVSEAGAGTTISVNTPLVEATVI